MLYVFYERLSFFLLTESSDNKIKRKKIMGSNNSAPITKVQGFQIGRVLANSPAHRSGLCPFFDIITGVDDIALDLDSVDFFKDYVSKHVDTEIRLTLFNLRVRSFRVVNITPSASWGGVGLLGCAMEWSSAEAALELTWHIESINADGPAAACPDLKAQRDYIIGMQAPDEAVVTLFTNASFSEKMEGWRALRRTNTPMSQSERETLLLLVFDSEANTVKEVPVHMGHHMSLGVEIADGYLHFVPEIQVTDPNQVSSSLPRIIKFADGSGDAPEQSKEPVASETEIAVPLAEPIASAPILQTSPQPNQPTAATNPPAPPTFPSFLPTATASHTQGAAHPVYPGALPFPTISFPPTVRPQTPAAVSPSR